MESSLPAPPAFLKSPWQPPGVRLPFGHPRLSFGGTDHGLHDVNSGPGLAMRLSEHLEDGEAIPVVWSRGSSGDHALGAPAGRDLGTPALRRFRTAV